MGGIQGNEMKLIKMSDNTSLGCLKQTFMKDSEIFIRESQT